MRNNFVLVVVTLTLGACASTRLEQSRQAPTGISSDQALVILGRASYNDKQTEESFTECLSENLAKGDNPIRLIPQEEFRDQMYPWFEPRTAPSSAEDLAELFAEPGVQERIEESKVRYLAWIDGDTVTTDQGGSFSCTISGAGGGCFGLTYWEEDASYQASIWDVENLTTSGKITANSSGTSYLAGVILPIPILARPGNSACKGLANQLREFLAGEGDA